jgi:hypothetical protein
MPILRRITVLILIAPLTPLAVGQSTSTVQLTSAPAHLNAPVFQFGPATPAPDLFGAHPFQAPVQPGPLKFSLKPWKSLPAADMFSVQLAARNQRAKIASVARNSICYAMRSYDFSVDQPGSDTTRWSGSSTCRPAMDAQLRAVQNPGRSEGR